jgi:hypothetical protein
MYEMERIKNGRIVRCTRIQECNLHCSDCNLTDICDDPLKEVDPDWTNPYKIGTQEHDAWDESERVGKVSPPEPVKPDEGLLLTDDRLSEINNGMPSTAKYGEVFKAIRDEQFTKVKLHYETELSKLQPELDRREARIKELEAELEVIDKNYRIKKGETWYWESNDENHLKSLTCPVIINADDLRKLLVQAKAEAYKEIGDAIDKTENPYKSKGVFGGEYHGTDYGVFEIARQSFKEVITKLQNGETLSK